MSKVLSDKEKEIMFSFSVGDSVAQIMAMYGIGKTKAYELRKMYYNTHINPIDTLQSDIINSTVGQSVVGIIGDTHFPYVRDGYLEFCYDTFEREGVTEVVHIGDIVDNHNWSRFNTEPDAESGISEFERAKDMVFDMNNMFNEWPISLMLGNHDRIPQRQLATLGLPKFLLKSFGELFNVSHWDICTSKIIAGVEYRHGLNCTATLLTAQRKRRSCVFGHSHSKADIQTHASWDDLVFGMHVGCGVDDSSLAMRYGEESVLKSIMSCGTVRDGKYPQLHFMDI